MAAVAQHACDPHLLQGLARPLLNALEARCAQQPDARPVLALTAPVGAGKSTLALQLQQLAARAGLRLAVASIDDAYRSWPDRQQRLAGNPFGVQRVPPGSHDPALLQSAITEWRHCGVLRLPRFDKTLNQGQGDRVAPDLVQADALLLEGWLVGYEPCGSAAIASWLEQHNRTAPADAGMKLSEAEQVWLPCWDQALAEYQGLWGCCNSFWVLQPQNWAMVRRWRLQAEARQRRRCGTANALSADAVSRMVRATQASLPPGLYQPALLRRASGVATLDGRRRCLAVSSGDAS